MMRAEAARGENEIVLMQGRIRVADNYERNLRDKI